MPDFPHIDSPCPFRADETPQPGRDHCGHCDRKVHNLDGMNAERRRAFLAGCSGKVCVAYTVHRSAQRRNAALGAGLIASLVGSGAAMAQDAQPTDEPSKPQPLEIASVPSSTTIMTAEEMSKIPIPEGVVFMGGILDPAAARWSDESELAQEADALPEIERIEWLPSKRAD